jgi:hypothetical protein
MIHRLSLVVIYSLYALRVDPQHEAIFATYYEGLHVNTQNQQFSVGLPATAGRADHLTQNQ